MHKMSLFGTNVTHRSGVKQTAHPVDISEEDIEAFRALNPDERLIRERTEKLRISHPELVDMSPEEALIVMKKVNHFNQIQRNLRSVTNLAKTGAVFFADEKSHIFTILSVARECR